jgi:hypothetical protein
MKRRLSRHQSLDADKRLSKILKLCPLNTAYENAPKKRPFGSRALNLYITEQQESLASGTRHDTPLGSRQYANQLKQQDQVSLFQIFKNFSKPDRCGG